MAEVWIAYESGEAVGSGGRGNSGGRQRDWERTCDIPPDFFPRCSPIFSACTLSAIVVPGEWRGGSTSNPVIDDWSDLLLQEWSSIG